MSLFPNSMYSAEQEELWSLLEEHTEIHEAKRQAGVLYDFDLIMREREHNKRFAAFVQRHRGKTFRVFRPEAIEALVRDDLAAFDDVLPPPDLPTLPQRAVVAQEG